MTHVAVAGAGIGGLAAALALARLGCRVSMFERATGFGETGAGVQLSPNACTVLRGWGVLEDIEAEAVRPSRIALRRGRDGAELASIPLGSAVERRYGAPFLTTRRSDLHRVLLAHASRHAAVELHGDNSVAGWSDRGAAVEIAVAGRGSVRADGLVGADGLHSVIRASLRRDLPDDASRACRHAWRGMVDAGALPTAFAVPASNLWLGRRRHLVHYPVAGGRLVNVVAITAGPRAEGSAQAPWSAPGDGQALSRLFADWCGPVRHLLAAAPEWRVWPLIDRPPLPVWSRGRVTLLGDAAHPMLPFLAQGAAQAIEDAAALAAAVAGHRTDLAAAFRAYEAARRPRTGRVQRASRRQGDIYHLGAPASVARDMVLRLTPPTRLLARFDWLYSHRS